MNRKFKVSSVLATLVLGSMLIGCGGSSSSDKKPNPGTNPAPKPAPKPTPKPVDARKCTFTPAILSVEKGKTFDAKKSIKVVDGKGTTLTDAVFTDADKVKTTEVKNYTVKVSSPSCDNSANITVKVINPTQGEAPTYGDPSLGQLGELVIQ